MSEDNSVTEAESRVAISEKLLNFWSNRAGWPRDSQTHIFLARAVDLLGMARFGPDWVALTDPTLPRAYDQRGAIFDELTEQLAKGEPATYTRAIEGGPFESITSDIWNTERFRPRFKYCLVNRIRPFDECEDESDGSYIYIDRYQFDKFVRSRPTCLLAIDDVDSLPIFLSAMVKTANFLDISANSPPLPVEPIQAAFTRFAVEAGVDKKHISKHLLRYAATLLRPPGAGRTAQKKIV